MNETNLHPSEGEVKSTAPHRRIKPVRRDLLVAVPGDFVREDEHRPGYTEIRTGCCDKCGLILRFVVPDYSPFELLCSTCATPIRFPILVLSISDEAAAAYFVSGECMAGDAAVLRRRNGGLAIGPCRCDGDEDEDGVL